MTNQIPNPKLKSLVILNIMKDLCQAPQLDFDILLAFSIGKAREFLYSHPEHQISIIQYLRFRWFLRCYKKGFSVAAITKHKEFYGLDFFVNKHVLIPRPETELMVAEAVEAIQTSDFRLQLTNGQLPKTEVRSPILLIDVGTGSGCIPISILKNLTEPVITYAIDTSRSALCVAKKNALKHGVKINFLRGNLLEPVIPRLGGEGLKARGGLDNKSLADELRPTHPYPAQAGNIIITANLPYLTEQQFQSEPSIQREPKKALVADNNGLALYEKLLKQIASFCHCEE